MKIAISICAGICVLLIVVSRGPSAGPKKIDVRRQPDNRLQQIAESALGEREGTIVVIDVQTGRVRAVVNPHLAFQEAFPPGSTIKAFTALAALRSGVINKDSRIRCREHYYHENEDIVCSHPRNLPPLNPTEAIAYSCNYFFANVGEALKQDDLVQTLSQFGFGRVTGVNNPDESGGVLLRNGWQAPNAIGEGRTLQVTPIQLLTAYAAVANGGHLLQPTLGNDTDSIPRVRSEIPIDDAARKIVLEGMRGAIKFGTAQKVGLDSLPSYIIGKTGTSKPLDGWRYNGWFVGLAFGPEGAAEPSNAQLGVVVLLKNAHGAEAAEIARPIFEEFSPNKTSTYVPRDTTEVSVRQVTDNVTRSMPLEAYITRVVATEGSIESEPEALKALAIAARTYALKNLKRHGQDGYDFCSTTHCQRFETSSQIRPIIAEAVKSTAGLVLKDEAGRIADSYFGASCGGMTANIQTLWGADAPRYLRGVRDDFCDAEAHSRWTDTIPANALAKALRSDPRTDVGETIRDLSVARQDETGRAELISIVGDRGRTISGWDFKLIVGRALGWNLLKSSRFTISRSGSAFVFHGSGFGHGLGLCQEGAHVMAQRGFTYRQILTKYFPGTNLGPRTATSNSSVDSSLRSEHFRVITPRTVDRGTAKALLALLESFRTDILRRAGTDIPLPQLEVFINETTGDFVGRTGMPAWAAAATKNNRIELQPLDLLKKRRILETTLRHELVHVIVDAIGNGQTPRWLTEGLALYVAGEGAMLHRVRDTKATSLEALEQKLASAGTAAEMQSAYAAAYNLVRELVRTEGERKVWQRVAQRNYSVSSR